MLTSTTQITSTRPKHLRQRINARRTQAQKDAARAQQSQWQQRILAGARQLAEEAWHGTQNKGQTVKAGEPVPRGD